MDLEVNMQPPQRSNGTGGLGRSLMETKAEALSSSTSPIGRYTVHYCRQNFRNTANG